jgi:2',3'-cyclic-nucleotide 2'-phosphodiesterase (5'-nucleotidase family)
MTSARSPLFAAVLALGFGLAGLSACAPAVVSETEVPPVADQVLTLRVIHTNDVHGRLLPQQLDGRPAGGLAVLAAHFDSARVHAPGKTVLVDGGDVMQGTAISNLSWGRATIDVFNALGYQGVAVGNHEFDWGVDTLRVRIAESSFPWLAANLFDEETGEHPAWVRPWVMVERDGVRTAIIGLALQTTPEVVMAGRTAGLRFGAGAEAIDRYVPEARAAGAHFVVVTGHVGATCAQPGEAPEDPSEDCEGMIIDIANAVTHRPDLMVGGHTHLRNFTDANGIPIMQAIRYTLAYGVVDLERTPGGQVTAVYRAIRPAWADEVVADTSIARLVAYWDEEVRPLTERVVVQLAEPLSNYDRQPGEQALGNLLADAQRIETGAHVGFVNVGSIRRSLPAGSITYGDLFELQPFQNELVSVTVSGSILRQALEHALGPDGRPRAFISGATVHYRAAGPPGERVDEIVLDDGRVIGDDDEVAIGTTEFLAKGGDAFTMLIEGETALTGLVDVDALVHYLESLPQPVAPPDTDRWREIP